MLWWIKQHVWENLRSCSADKATSTKIRVHSQLCALLVIVITERSSWSLSVKDVTKSIKILDEAIGTTGEIIFLIKYSPKRKKIWGILKNRSNLMQMVLQWIILQTLKAISKLSETRWTIQAGCFRKILDNYSDLIAAWNHCLENDKMALNFKARIIGVRKKISSV